MRPDSRPQANLHGRSLSTGTNRIHPLALFALGGLLLLALAGCSPWAGADAPNAAPVAAAAARAESAPPSVQTNGRGASAAGGWVAPGELRRITAPRYQPYAGDPLAPRPAPVAPAPYTRYYAETGHYLAGEFLDYHNTLPGAAYLLGLPLTEEFPQQLPDGRILRVQYFERARLEWHPELPEGQRVQLGALVPAVLNGRTFERVAPVANDQRRVYFPETGHTLSEGFLDYWRRNGGLRVFGYPLSEEMGEGGVTVQYFERARFEYHAGLAGTPYAVQLSPVGYLALEAGGWTLPPGSQVRFNPPRVAEGHTATIQVAARDGVTVTGTYQGRPLLFQRDSERGVSWALLGTNPLGDTGPRSVAVTVQTTGGASRTVTRTLEVVPFAFPSEVLRFDEETSQLLDPKLTAAERETLDRIFSGRSPVRHWAGPFRMPIDGQIRVTSYFATRRCYNCAAGGTPTSYHGGMDMRAAEGTPVRAPEAGVVVYAGPLAVRGNTVIIDHGMGVFTLLAHNSRVTSTVGQAVAKGEQVALSGNTGLSNGPHVHWEVRVSGPPVDPLEWVNRAMP
ncbi:MAG TPA: M23 family metallopeptidase [Chloroflexia bacterium]|nr:M23 family metallopeptidase [Chloroflexia bacterium]